MLQLLRRFGTSRHDGGSLRCPRCQGTRIRLVEQIGAVDRYRCATILTPLYQGARSRECGQRFLHNTIPAEDIPAAILRKRPALAYGRTESEGRVFLPDLSKEQVRNLFPNGPSTLLPKGA